MTSGQFDRAIGPSGSAAKSRSGRTTDSLDNVVTIPASLLGRTVGFLASHQETLLARASVLAHDLDIALLDT